LCQICPQTEVNKMWKYQRFILMFRYTQHCRLNTQSKMKLPYSTVIKITTS
jgi:hypothetical protein